MAVLGVVSVVHVHVEFRQGAHVNLEAVLLDEPGIVLPLVSVEIRKKLVLRTAKLAPIIDTDDRRLVATHGRAHGGALPRSYFELPRLRSVEQIIVKVSRLCARHALHGQDVGCNVRYAPLCVIKGLCDV